MQEVLHTLHTLDGIVVEKSCLWLIGSMAISAFLIFGQIMLLRSGFLRNWDSTSTIFGRFTFRGRYIMNREVIQAGTGSKPVAPYSPGIKAGGFIHVSGQVPVDSQSGEIVAGDIEEQTRQTLENIKVVLEAGGSSMNKVVKCTVFLTDISEFSRMNEVYSSFFPQDPPARSTIEVSKLAIDIKVEIEAVAVV